MPPCPLARRQPGIDSCVLARTPARHESLNPWLAAACCCAFGFCFCGARPPSPPGRAEACCCVRRARVVRTARSWHATQQKRAQASEVTRALMRRAHALQPPTVSDQALEQQARARVLRAAARCQRASRGVHGLERRFPRCRDLTRLPPLCRSSPTWRPRRQTTTPRSPSSKTLPAGFRGRLSQRSRPTSRPRTPRSTRQSSCSCNCSSSRCAAPRRQLYPTPPSECCRAVKSWFLQCAVPIYASRVCCRAERHSNRHIGKSARRHRPRASLELRVRMLARASCVQLTDALYCRPYPCT